MKCKYYQCSGLTSVTIGSGMTSIGNNAFDGVDIPTIISLIENPFTITEKTSNSRTFSQNTFNNATLYVPKGTIEKYKATDGWKDFLFIEEGTGSGDTPETQKCEKPTISYENGKLTFSCATEGATCQYSITDTDIKAGSGNEVQLGVTYNISVYAAKAGYENSETATATLCWIDQQPKTEGITNGIANIPANAVLIQSEGGSIKVQGVDEGTQVNVYGINYAPSTSGMFSTCPSSPMVCSARQSSSWNTYTVTGYATVASLPAMPPERVRTCNTEFVTCPFPTSAMSSEKSTRLPSLLTPKCPVFHKLFVPLQPKGCICNSL